MSYVFMLTLLAEIAAMLLVLSTVVVLHDPDHS